MFTLVPVNFFDPKSARKALSEVAAVAETDTVEYKDLPAYGAVLIYTVPSGAYAPPGILHILEKLQSCPEYNKVLCSWTNGLLELAIAQGRSLLLANEYKAPDFVTAQYFIFLAMKSLQLNPEVTTICFTHPLDEIQQMALYRYFKAVETI